MSDSGVLGFRLLYIAIPQCLFFLFRHKQLGTGRHGNSAQVMSIALGLRKGSEVPMRFARRFEHVILAAMNGAINNTKLVQLRETEIEVLEEAVWRHHTHQVEANKCTSVLMQMVKAPVEIVWSIVRRFDMPQTYKRFIKTCVMKGDLKVGSVRDITVVSGVPASHSTERLEALDEDNHIIGFKVICGEHRLQNYRSIATLHEVEIDNMKHTLVFESYVVDIPEGNTKDDTCLFADTVVRCNLQSLAMLAERVAVKAAQVKSDAVAIML